VTNVHKNKSHAKTNDKECKHYKKKMIFINNKMISLIIFLLPIGWISILNNEIQYEKNIIIYDYYCD
jgi:hypothetical protein